MPQCWHCCLPHPFVVLFERHKTFPSLLCLCGQLALEYGTLFSLHLLCGTNQLTSFTPPIAHSLVLATRLNRLLLIYSHFAFQKVLQTFIGGCPPPPPSILILYFCIFSHYFYYCCISVLGEYWYNIYVYQLTINRDELIIQGPSVHSVVWT